MTIYPSNFEWNIQDVVGRHSAVLYRLATDWTVRGSKPDVGEIFATFQTGPGTHPASYTMGTGSFPGVKRPGRDFDHPPQYSAEVKERIELYLHL